MTHEGDLLRAVKARLRVEEISAADKSFGLPPVSIHSIDSCRSFLAIDCHALIQTFSIRVEIVETHS